VEQKQTGLAAFIDQPKLENKVQTVELLEASKLNETPNVTSSDQVQVLQQEQQVEIPERVQIAMMKSQIAKLSGLYIIIRMPTEERLNVTFGPISQTAFDQLRPIVLQHMKDVDDKYKIKSNRGRSGKATFEKVTGTTYAIKFSPFPSSIINIFKRLRNMRVDAYHRFCVVLERQGEHAYQNNINILPYSMAPDFVKAVEEMDKTIDEANTKINEFIQQAPEWSKLVETVKPYGVSEVLSRPTWNMEHCTPFATEIALETAQVKQHIEEEYRKMFTEIDAEKTKAIENVHTIFEKGEMDITRQTLESLQKDMTTMAKNIMAASKRDPERAKRELEHLRRKIVSLGLQTLEPTVMQLQEVADNPEKAPEIFGSTDVAAAIDGRMKGFIAGLGETT
jgi:hypothetical protein